MEDAYPELGMGPVLQAKYNSVSELLDPIQSNLYVHYLDPILTHP